MNLSHFAVTKRSHCSLGTFLQDRGHDPRRRRPSSDIYHRPAVWSSWPSNIGNTGDAGAHRPLAWRSAGRYPGEKTFISIEGSRIWARKSKGNQGHYRIIDCTTYIHHQYSSEIIISHQSSSIIINHACIFHTICTLTCSNSNDTYSYNPNKFLQTSAPLLLPLCIKSLHVLLICFKRMC